MTTDIQAILKLEVPLVVLVDQRTMSVQDVVNLAPGAIIELPKESDDELDIFINDKPIGQGTAVKVGENFGVRIRFCGDVKQRIEALGGTGDAQKLSSQDEIDSLTDQLLAGQ